MSPEPSHRRSRSGTDDYLEPDERRTPPASGLAITLRAGGSRRVIVRVEGEIDLANAEWLAERLRGELSTQCDELVLDLAGVTFCDCAGLSALVRVHDRCQWQHTRLILDGVSPTLARTLQITGLDRTLTSTSSGRPARPHASAVPRRHPADTDQPASTGGGDHA